MKPLPAHLHELTAIRAFAAMVVVNLHLNFSDQDTPTFWNNMIADGHLGVDLFFMLSGFILTHVYVQAWRDGSFSYQKFLINRFARLYPLHIFIIGLFVLAYLAMDVLHIQSDAQGQNWPDLKWHILLMHAWGFTDSHTWNFPSWSVSAEVFAYLLFPATLWIALRLRPAVGGVVSIVVFGAASLFALQVLNRPITKLMFDFGILRVMTEFFMGVALYLIIEKYRLHDAWIGPVVWGSLVSLIVLSGIQADERLIVLVLGAFLAGLAHLSLQDRSNILRHPVLIYLGEISYATYMIHLLVIMVMRALAPKLGIDNGMLFSVITIAGIYAASVILHHTIERPGRIMIRTTFARFKANKAKSPG